MSVWQERVAATDWDAVRTELETVGGALTGPLVTPAEAAGLAAIYPDATRFRSTIDMARYRFGEGQYRYFHRPYPEIVTELKYALYPRLLPIARDWWTRLRRDPPWPDSFDDWLATCHRAGQTRTTALLLRYGAGGYRTHRVFFADEKTAAAAGYRPCAVCLPEQYRRWKGRR